ncbi:MAG: RAMP superfamily CRISPR-associated protein [Acidobacteria bacterium]|nr:RAMP superfamily CRISPR-associated protein [Acidobacteriota bacterium]
MARKIVERYRIEGCLVAQAPLCVGGLGGDVDVDLALARNGQGQLYVPGTSFAGPMREWVRRALKADEEQCLFGFQEDDQGFASRLLVEDAVIVCDQELIEVRDGVGIDRRFGSAANQAKYDRAALPKGTNIPLNMTLEIPFGKTGESIKGCLRALIQAMKDARLGFGAARTRGLGKVKLEGIKIHREGWFCKPDVLEVLRNGGKPLEHVDDIGGIECKLDEPARLEIGIKWEPVGPVMVKAEAAGTAVDMLPLVGRTSDKDEYALVLPGSGIKGALRTQAERIVRTVLGMEAPKEFLEQVNVPLIEYLFGAARPEKGNKAKDEQNNSSITIHQLAYC